MLIITRCAFTNTDDNIHIKIIISQISSLRLKNLFIAGI